MDQNSSNHSGNKSETPRKVFSIIKDRITKNFILFALFTAVIIAFSYPLPGKLASSYMTSDFRIIELCNNIIVFLISGITLKLEDLRSVFRYKYLVVYGLTSINLITTLICFLTLLFPFPTKSYAVGLTIFCSVPTTLGVGVALTQEAKGDKIMSLFMTVVSNMLGIVTIPFLLQIYLANASLGPSKVQLDPEKLAYRLSLTVLAPTIFGMLCRQYIPRVAPLVDHYKAELGMFSMANLMTIVWMSLSGARNLIFEQNPVEILVLFIVAVLIHLFYLGINYLLLIKVFHRYIPLKQAISVLIMASQKSSPVALSVIAVVAKTTSAKGLLTIPCVLGQIGQIFVGSLITRHLALWVEAETRENIVESKASNELHEEIPQNGDNLKAIELSIVETSVEEEQKV